VWPRRSRGLAAADDSAHRQRVLSNLASEFGDALVDFINDVNSLTRTPENLSYNHDLVRQFTTATQVMADGLLAVVVLVSGYNILLRPYLGSTYRGALEFLPRLLLGGADVDAEDERVPVGAGAGDDEPEAGDDLRL
jgi:hypothetical protein